MSQHTETITRESLMLDTPFAAPSNETETTILTIWSEAFGIAGLGIDDDFFDLGGNSLIAATVTRQIGEALGVPLKTGALVEANTVREIAMLVQDRTGSSLPSHIVPLRSVGDRIPIFIVHGAAGLLFPSPAFMGGFHDDQPVYAFQVPGYDGQSEPLETVEAIASEYLRCMKLVSPRGPWHLSGFCHGSWIAFEMASQLRDEGQKPESVTVVDPGVQEGRMLSDYMHFLRRHGKGPVAASLSEMKSQCKGLLNTWRCYRATGIWADPTNPDSCDIPQVWDYIDMRNRKRQARALKKAAATASREELEERQWMWDRQDEGAFETEKELELRRTAEANTAIDKLKLAYYKYAPRKSLDIPAHMIASEFQNEKLKDPTYPIRRFMPDLDITVLGQYHNDTVSTSGPENASIIQRVADEASGC
ncbi:thioesterase domain-containing protein [Hoeflea sp. CAU 1731]